MLESIKQAVTNCRDCPLNGSNPVIYRGNPQAKIAVIGMGPGQEEQDQGLPFVGPAGQLANQIISSMGLNPEEDVFWTNVIMHRTLVNNEFKNRDPTLEESKACSKHLNNLIDFVRPEVIIAFGKPALAGLLQTEISGWIRNHCGKLHIWRDYDVFAMLHPAYLLRNQDAIPLAKEHCKLFIKQYKHLLGKPREDLS